MKITLIVGLPGSGKTWLANQLLEQDPQAVFIDDPKNSELIKGYADRNILIADPNLCDSHIRSSAIQALVNIYPGCEIDWHFFENNIQQCKENVKFRSDGRNVENTINFLSKIYNVPTKDNTTSVVYKNMQTHKVFNTKILKNLVENFDKTDFENNQGFRI